ncbi:hypothetical protein [Bradyrhizobium sp.]
MPARRSENALSLRSIHSLTFGKWRMFFQASAHRRNEMRANAISETILSQAQNERARFIRPTALLVARRIIAATGESYRERSRDAAEMASADMEWE